MATSSRQSALFGVQDWKRFYQTYRDADFQSFDYETLRKSFIEYITQSYPETFNDYIESSEFVALLDVIAFMGQALAFRGDLNARENFIDTAERRDSVIKLANLVGYTPQRNLSAQGLLKVTAISTTENVIDINGTNLSNAVILWNDPANSIWQEQFNVILNAAFVNTQRIGKFGHSKNILGVRTDEYNINIPDNQRPVIPFSAEIDGQIMNFELVNVSSLNHTSLKELVPIPQRQFSILYRNDKMGFASPDTGFFFYFKQGTLQELDFQFNEQIENNFYLIDIQNINNEDTWLTEIDINNQVSETWTKVENIFAANVSQNIELKKIFSVLSRTNDQITYLFGDGVYSEIPIGRYRAYVRSSNGLSYNISTDELSGIIVSINYISKSGKTEALTFTLTLQQTVTNAMQRESLTQIKERAPSKYYTQNRMVNGEDYTNFPYATFNSIIKSKAVNRTSIGISRSQDVTDPTGKYSNINVFSDDGVIYLDESNDLLTFDSQNKNTITEFLSSVLPNRLITNEVLQFYHKHYPRITGKTENINSVDHKIYWKKKTLNSGTVTGYFYIKNSSAMEIPISVGITSTTSTRYITEGANLKFMAPLGKYFDKSNRLVTGVPSFENEGTTYIWVQVIAVVNDGYNNGLGTLGNGTGPVILNRYVPDEAYLDNSVTNPNATTEPEKYYGNAIIPTFSNKIGKLINDISNLINLKVNQFTLVYDHMVLNESDRYTISRTINNTYKEILIFNYDITEDKYIVQIKNTTYIFGSEKNVKFLFNSSDSVYDISLNGLVSDNINILKINTNPYYNSLNVTPNLLRDLNLYIYDQDLYRDGTLNEHSVKITNIDKLSKYAFEPDFYKIIIGDNSGNIYFTTENSSEINLQTNILPNDFIISAYHTREDIEEVKYEYQPNTVFFAKNGDGIDNIPKFYISSVVPLTVPPVLVISDITSNYIYSEGKYKIKFMYNKTNTNNYRVDPSTTNIIDLYLVTDSYYNLYRSWLLDITNSIVEPDKPSINQLKQTYANLDTYKMLSDTLIFNSVSFKPIFGTKAELALQGIIKVVKNPASVASESQIRTSVLNVLNNYFTLDKWDFGDTFYFSELSAYLHVELAGLISSVVVVPLDPNKSFGDLYEVKCMPNEIFVNGATVNDIVVINSLSSRNLQQR